MIWFTDDTAENTLTALAGAAGFAGFYALRSAALEQPALYALLVAVMAHHALEYPDIEGEVLRWKQRLEPLATVLRNNPDYTSAVSESLWQEAYSAMMTLALTELQPQGLPNLTAKLQRRTPLSEADSRQLITALSRSLQFRTVLLQEFNGVGSFSDETQAPGVQFWVVIGTRANGDCYCFIDWNFRRGLETRGFPFYSESPEDRLALKGFPNGRARDINAEFITATLRMLVDAQKGVVQPAAALEYRDSLIPWKQRLDPAVVSEVDALLSSLSKHEVTACVGGVLQPLECGHRFHRDCLEVQLKRSKSYVCPTCSVAISAPTLRTFGVEQPEVLSPSRILRSSPFSSISQKCLACMSNRSSKELLKDQSGHPICSQCMESKRPCSKCSRA